METRVSVKVESAAQVDAELLQARDSTHHQVTGVAPAAQGKKGQEVLGVGGRRQFRERKNHSEQHQDSHRSDGNSVESDVSMADRDIAQSNGSISDRNSVGNNVNIRNSTESSLSIR